MRNESYPQFIGDGEPSALYPKAKFGPVSRGTAAPCKNVDVFDPSPNCPSERNIFNEASTDTSPWRVPLYLRPNQSVTERIRIREIKVWRNAGLEILKIDIRSDIYSGRLAPIFQDDGKFIDENGSLDFLSARREGTMPSMRNHMNVQRSDIGAKLLLSVVDRYLVACEGSVSSVFGSFGASIGCRDSSLCVGRLLGRSVNEARSRLPKSEGEKGDKCGGDCRDCIAVVVSDV